MKARFINATPHRIYHIPSGLDLPPAKAEDIIRVSEERVKEESCEDATIYTTQKVMTNELPPKLENTFYVVSKRVVEYISLNHLNRDDFVYPAMLQHEYKEIHIKDSNNNPLYYANGEPATRTVMLIGGCMAFKRILSV